MFEVTTYKPFAPKMQFTAVHLESPGFLHSQDPQQRTACDEKPHEPVQRLPHPGTSSPRGGRQRPAALAALGGAPQRAAWGTVREDYSPDGNAWDYFPHDQARTRAYRWGEDGLAGFSDSRSGSASRSPLERPRPDPQGTPVRPDQRPGQPRRGRQGALLLPRRHAHPLLHEDALQVSAARRFRTSDWWRRTGAAARTDPEFELIDTGVFDDDRYFDVFVEYAKAAPRRHPDAHHRANRGPDARRSHLLPHLWFRNTWSWERGAAPARSSGAGGERAASPAIRSLGGYMLFCDGRAGELLFYENETNAGGCFRRRRTRRARSRTAFNDYVVHGSTSAVNPQPTGTKAAPQSVSCPAGG